MHDYDDNGFWDGSEIRKTYGMDDPSAKDVPEDKREAIAVKIFELMDHNENGVVEKEEFMKFIADGGSLPDFDLGPGHHWDMETEYEIHHWER